MQEGQGLFIYLFVRQENVELQRPYAFFKWLLLFDQSVPIVLKKILSITNAKLKYSTHPS